MKLISSVVSPHTCVIADGFRWVKPAASLKQQPPAAASALHAEPTSFRWVKPAASLKPGIRRRCPGSLLVVAGFRWVKPAASLKRSCLLAAAVDGGLRFRWVKPAASLKLRLRRHGLGRLLHVSAG